MIRSYGFLLVLLLASPLFAQGPAQTLFREPTVSASQIVFAYGGDLWIVPRSGGNARRLTTDVGIESDPYFSPDGRWIAFTGQYDGNTDVFVVPAEGGVPKRLTYHPAADQASGWSPDGRSVLFSSNRGSYANFLRLYTIGTDGGGLPSEIKLPMAIRGSFSPDARRIAYEPLSQWQGDWKYYKGGQTQPIWLADVATSAIEKVPRENSNDSHPMWVGSDVYFLSNRDGGIVTLFRYETGSKRVQKVVDNNGLDIKSASTDGKSIIYEQFGTIYVFDPGAGSPRKVDIRVAGDFPGIRPRFESVGSSLSNAGISPTGARAVFEARGEIITAPADKGNFRNITNTTGVMERDPAWSPDGKWIAYFSDESGEYRLHLADQSGMGEVRKITLAGGPAFYSSPVWSPDSKKIAYNDNHVNLWILDVESGAATKVDQNIFGVQDGVLSPAWSPDSNWIAYTKQLDNRLRAVYLYSLDKADPVKITDGLGDARYVAFDKGGKFLFFTASTDVGPTISFADLSGIAHQTSRAVYAIVLRNDIPSPFAPESDEEKVKEEPKPSPSPAEGPKPDETPKPDQKPAAKDESVRIDLENIDQRIVSVSQIPSRNYTGLYAGKAGTLFITEFPSGPQSGPFGQILHKFDLEKRKLDKADEGVSSFTISADGSKVLIRKGPGWTISAAGAPPRPGEGRINTGEMRVRVEPRAEWRQMFNEIWRGERDFLYDPGTHGLNIEKAKRLYAPYLNAVVHRDDLNYLFREMLNQISVGHMFIGGGDIPSPNRVSGGLLGADYVTEQNRYRISRVYNGENWNPNLRAPLTEPGVNVKAGEFLLAVNGRDLTAADNLYRHFEATAGRQVVIKVGPNADGSGSREVTVVPVGNDGGLRNLAWIEDNRRTVDRLSGGKLAYVYIPNTGGGGYSSFNRYFFAQTDKQGAVIDERFNGGGLLADYVVEYLKREQLAMITFRDGKDWKVPAGAIYGPKAMLINELAGSGGDAMPWFFKKLEVGPLVGKRTWGGLVAAFGIPTLMDGGSVRAPNGAAYGLQGEWEVENVGVAPDIEVEFDPAMWRQGRDPQLERAVEYLLDEIRKNPPKTYDRPPYPDYHKGRPLGNQ